MKKATCDLCDHNPATTAIENKHNGKKLKVCKACADYVLKGRCVNDD